MSITSLCDADDVLFWIFQVVYNYRGRSQSLEKTVLDIDWPGVATGPPPDTPECGFDDTSLACLQGIPTFHANRSNIVKAVYKKKNLRQDILPMVVKTEKIDFRCFV